MIVMIMVMIVTVMVKLGILSRNVEGPWFMVMITIMEIMMTRMGLFMDNTFPGTVA